MCLLCNLARLILYLIITVDSLLHCYYPHIFWSPCIPHCKNNIFKDSGALPTYRSTIEKARKIMVFIYSHNLVLNLMREFTEGKELTRSWVTKFATNYLILRSIQECKPALKRIFVLKYWRSRKLLGKE